MPTENRSSSIADEIELHNLREQLQECADDRAALMGTVKALRTELADQDAMLREQSGQLIALAARLIQEPLRALNRDLDSDVPITRIKVTNGIERAGDSLGGLAAEVRRVADALSASTEPESKS